MLTGQRNLAARLVAVPEQPVASEPRGPMRTTVTAAVRGFFEALHNHDSLAWSLYASPELLSRHQREPLPELLEPWAIPDRIAIIGARTHGIVTYVTVYYRRSGVPARAQLRLLKTYDGNYLVDGIHRMPATGS